MTGASKSTSNCFRSVRATQTRVRFCALRTRPHERAGVVTVVVRLTVQVSGVPLSRRLRVKLAAVCHLVADSHQPRHAGSLYVEHVFESKDGDRSANSIPTKQSKNMHALWDGLLSRDFNEGDVSRSPHPNRIAQQAKNHCDEQQRDDPKTFALQCIG